MGKAKKKKESNPPDTQMPSPAKRKEEGSDPIFKIMKAVAN